MSEMVQVDSTHTNVPDMCESGSLMSDMSGPVSLMSDMSRAVSSASHFEDDALRVFSMWVKPFHINFS